MAPLQGATYRAVLCEFVPVDHSDFEVGPTGTYKSELSALLMQHVGPEFDRLHLPAQWSSSDNALERLAFDFKDVPLVIDDFAPTGSATDVARLHAKADRVIRGVGNRGSRGRMNADGSLRPNYPPRGVIIGTGEDAPRGQSLRARMEILEVEPGDVDLERLTAAQEAGRTGVFAAATAGYLQWIARHIHHLRERFPQLLAEFRARARHDGTHARTPDAVAHRALGWWVYLQFAVDIDVLTDDKAEALFVRVWKGLGEAAARQAHHQASEEPAQHFIDLLGSALSGGFAHIAAGDGDAPPNARAWGWRQGRVGSGPHERTDWSPQGVRAGWLEGGDLYLDRDAALTAVQKVGQAIGRSIGVTPTTLAKRLNERGFLMSTGKEHGELQVRRSLEGRRRRVLHLAGGAITLEESGQTGQSGLSVTTGTNTDRLTAVSGRIGWPDIEDGRQESGPETRPHGAERDGTGRNGRIGRIPDEGRLSQPTVVHVAVPGGDDLATEVGEWNG
jgi:hypothetical protein